MDRKKFIQYSSLAGLFFRKFTNPGSVNSLESKDNSLNQYKFPLDFELNEISAKDLQEKLRNGHYTSVQIVQLYLKRIEEIDRNGPQLNSIIELNPDALSIAHELDRERSIGKWRGALHGIPILIKDNISTSDKMMTTAGALAMVGNHALKDAFIVQKLREAGAIILGKTNLSEWANFRSTLSTSGWSSRGKQTKSAYVLDRNPSGSSSGTGTAIASNLACLGIGTETDGSIVSPSSINGLVGLKPTVGLWSRSGIIPISKTQDTAGPMTRTVEDAAILLGALTGMDPDDSKSKESEHRFLKDYSTFLNIEGLKGKKIGIEKSHLIGNERIIGLFKRSLEKIKELGGIIVEIDIQKAMEKARSAEFTILQYEFKDGLNHYLNQNPGPMKNLQDIIHFNQAHSEEAMPYFQQETLISSQSMGDLNDKTYQEALALGTSSRTIILELMKTHQLDALGGITNGLACCIDLANGDYDTGYSLSTPAAISGLPHITVPMGMVHELPLGISFFAGPYEEGKLIEMAYAFEQATQKRTPPKFIPRIGF